MDQPAEIDTRNGVIPGKVIRIDPASINGTVSVDAGLTGGFPKAHAPTFASMAHPAGKADQHSLHRPSRFRPALRN